VLEVGDASLGFPSIAGCPKFSEFQKGRSISIAKPSVVKTHGNLRVLYPPKNKASLRDYSGAMMVNNH